MPGPVQAHARGPVAGRLCERAGQTRWADRSHQRIAAGRGRRGRRPWTAQGTTGRGRARARRLSRSQTAGRAGRPFACLGGFVCTSVLQTVPPPGAGWCCASNGPGPMEPWSAADGPGARTGAGRRGGTAARGPDRGPRVGAVCVGRRGRASHGHGHGPTGGVARDTPAHRSARHADAWTWQERVVIHAPGDVEPVLPAIPIHDTVDGVDLSPASPDRADTMGPSVGPPAMAARPSGGQPSSHTPAPFPSACHRPPAWTELP